MYLYMYVLLVLQQLLPSW